ncbi:MAG: nucleoid-associated protein [Eggerthellaceae bacterium]|nr:nucleoid-associated protein [Eggerthellaceae bacterium]
MKINQAILHVFDFVACVNVMAQAPMDLGNKTAKRYVTSQAKRMVGNLDSKRGEFAANSGFAAELDSYFRGQGDFVELSLQVADYLAAELGRMEKTPSTDLLVIDFEGDADTTVREMTDEEAEAAFEARGPRYFAIALLEAKQAYMHEMGTDDFGATRTTIARHNAILPNPSQKLASFALIAADDMSVRFVDKPREIAGENKWLIPDGLLQCSMEASSKEVLEAVTAVVEEVAEEFGANTAVALSRAKAYVAEHVAEADEPCPEVYPEEMAREVFAEQPQVAERFSRVVEEGALPEKVVVEKAVAKRVTRNHKIRTDTGIEITFPAEYGENPEYIQFTSTADGHYEIALKNIGAIENR